MHFFSPVPVMPLVELIRGAATDDATEAAIRELAAELGKQVIVSADRPGFIVNRILMPFLAEAMRACEEGLGTAEDIDTGARVGLNHPMGPLELADFIGLDVCLGIMRVLHEGLGQPQFAPPAILERLVARGPPGPEDGPRVPRLPTLTRRRPMTSRQNAAPVYIVGAARTPIGKFGGALAGVPAVELGAVAIRAAVERAGLAEGVAVDEVIMGQVLGAGSGQAPARQALLRAGLADTTPATTINRVCGSGLKAVMFAAASIRAGDGDLYVAGGMESMNQAPYLLRKARFGYRLGAGSLDDSAVTDGLWCAIDDCHMGTHAERVAIRAGVSRADQDAFALESHRRAVAAQDEGRFDAEMAPVTVRDAKGRETMVAVDEGPRRDTTLEALARLAPVFDLPEGEDRGTATVGTVTAGNAPGITDGAAALVVASERAVERHGLTPHRPRRRATPRPRSTPKWLFLAPIEGVRALERKTGLAAPDYDLVEVNEAFAAQVLADGRRARPRLGPGQRQRRRDRPGAPDRGVGGADRRHAAPRAGAPRRANGSRDALPGRRRVRGDGGRADLMRARRRLVPDTSAHRPRHLRYPSAGPGR